MGKVVTSQGLQAFVAEGKFDTVKNDAPPKKGEAPPPPLDTKERVAEKVAAVIEAPKTEEKPDYKDDDAETQAEIDKSERFKKLIGKKHYEMKKAQAEAESADRLAEDQFNRARLAEAKLAEQDAELKKLRAQEPAKEAPKAEKPDPAKFQDDKGQFKAFEYAEALAAWSADQSIAKYKADQETARKAQESAVAEARAIELVNKAKEKHADYDEVISAFVAKNNLSTHPQVIAYLSTSDQIGELNYYIAQHPEFVAKLNAMHPLKAIAAVRDVELTFEKPAAKTEEVKTEVAPKVISGAPAPITPLPNGGSVDTNTDPSRMDFKQLRAFRRAQERAKHH
jgi:hypothetical protein